MKRVLLLIFLGGLVPSAAGAVELVLPLRFGFQQVAQQAALALRMDEEGRVTIERNNCNRVRLSDLIVISEAPRAWISVAFDADLGTRLFKKCLGPKGAQGRLNVLLQPEVADEGFAVVLKLESAELLKADGSSGLLTRPAQVLAEKIVLPRMDDIRIDLQPPLAAIDELIRSFAETDAPLLADRSRLVSVAAEEQAVRATVTLQLAERTAPPEPEAALTAEELAQWSRVEDELDGFLTAAILALAQATENRDLQLDLLAALLDARTAISRALVENDDGVTDPIRDLFVASWDQIRPAVLKLQESQTKSLFPGLQLTTFMAGADAIAALDALGPEYGIDISRDGIRRLARMLLAGNAPVAFTPLPLAVDLEMVNLFGFRSPAAEEQVVRGHWLDWLLPAALADEVPAPMDLIGLVPSRSQLKNYLAVIAKRLVEGSVQRLAASDRIPAEVEELFTPLVLATAWKESCWRHYLTEEQPPEVIRSSIGAVGMMQINGRVWRGIYDLERLEREIDYNIAAGVEILEHYLVHYAIRHGEHQLPGGPDNLPKATYAAYNGGPGHRARYRRESTPSRLRSIDEIFWDNYQRIRTTGWPNIASCYAVTGELSLTDAADQDP